MLAVLREEEAEPTPEILFEVSIGKLIRIEDERCKQPRDNGYPDGHPRHSKSALPGATCTYYQDSAGKQQHAIVVGVHGVVQVKTTDSLHGGPLARSDFPDEGPTLCWQPTASRHVCCPAIAQLVHNVVGNDLGLEYEVQGGSSGKLLEQAHKRMPEGPLKPNLGKKRQGGCNQEEQQDPRVPDREGLGHRPCSRLVAAVQALE
mmetsp:Transcript_124965/g.364992  ORF Transcript_124965/g.364992 Transcript_124965/m.364992 type:complete len:204 (+) Transcript_124965:1864-2475(+)